MIVLLRNAAEVDAPTFQNIHLLDLYKLGNNIERQLLNRISTFLATNSSTASNCASSAIDKLEKGTETFETSTETEPISSSFAIPKIHIQ